MPDAIVKIVLSGFVLLLAFNAGRVDASRAYLRSACDIPPADRMDLKTGYYNAVVVP
jgi:hypothetical protein